jgi:hypothetical protein
MSDLQRRPDYTPRRQREKRAYQLAMVGGGAAVVAVVGVILAIVGVVGSGLPLTAAVVAAICLILFRRLVKPA